MARRTAEIWIVYILRCADGTLYTGITNDLDRRCRQHNAGKASRYTRSRLPVTLVYQENQSSRGAALKREAAIKSLSRREKEALICHAYFVRGSGSRARSKRPFPLTPRPGRS